MSIEASVLVDAYVQLQYWHVCLDLDTLGRNTVVVSWKYTFKQA